MGKARRTAGQTATAHVGRSAPIGGMEMSNRTLSALVAGAFIAAVGSLAATPAPAQSKAEMEKMMKEKQAMTMKALEGGKMEKCFGVALKGQNDCFAGAGATFARASEAG